MDAARLKLVIDNPYPAVRRRDDSLAYRMGTLAAYAGAAGFALGCWWLVVTLVFSLG